MSQYPVELSGTLINGHKRDFIPTDQVVISGGISAGQHYNLYYDSDVGARRARVADAALGYEAHGYVLDDYVAGETITGFRTGDNTALSGLTPGIQYFLSTAGGITTTEPTASGHLSQIVGMGSDTGTLLFQPGLRVYL